MKTTVGVAPRERLLGATQEGARRRDASRGALVLGAHYTALGILRSLGRRGIRSWMTMDGRTIARYSRYVERTFIWPSEDESAQLEFLVNLARSYGLDGWTVFPSNDPTAALMARHHDELSRYFRLTVPPWDRVKWAYDKRLIHDLALELGIDHAWSRCPVDRAEVERFEWPFPVVVKAAIKERENDFTTAKAWRANDRQALLFHYDRACSLVDQELVMVQELIPGDARSQFSYTAVCENGEVIAWLTACRARQYPVDFSYSSTYVQTVTCPPIENPSKRLLRHIGYTGIAEFEFKRDPRTDEYKLHDINPRAWGWLSLSPAAGVDFPYMLWQIAQGEPVEAVSGEVGVRWVYVTKDIAAAATEIRRGTLSLKEYVSSLRPPITFALFAKDDPLPALVDAPLLFRRAWQRS